MSTYPHFVCDDDVVAIGRGLFDRTLPKSQWTHAAHLAAAVWIVTSRPDLDAAAALPPAIRAYNEATGVANTETGGYHETITQASLHAVRAFVEARAGAPLHALCNALLDSPMGSPDWLLRYWSRPVLFSVAARKGWVDPDIAELPGRDHRAGSR
jgi:hypothetical protein